MKERIRKTITALARPWKLERLIGLSGEADIFPFYHTVSPEPLPHISHLYRVRKPEEFERDLEQLLSCFEPVSLASCLENRKDTRGRRRMVLSFDDGLSGCYQYIAPLLKKRGIPALFFLNNRFIDNRALFYRYKASLLLHRSKEDCRAREQMAAFLKIPEEQLETSIRMIAFDQRALLDALAREAELDFSAYLRSRAVYMDSEEIRELLRWGFDIGAHSADHMDFTLLEADEMIRQVLTSIRDLQQRFGISTSYFSFPFTSDGVPKQVIESLLEEGLATTLMGSAGLKRTGHPAFIQRIPMEQFEADAFEALKTEYLSFLFKKVAGLDRLRY
ncbi:MAG: polysaccharide deacetylase family protein [Bacteroidales bacterium]|nr:polysaccharide deacetylase family protein [Bacteroidales bacterium]